MGTSGVIARAVGDGFEGRYHHWDSYPAGLGNTLIDLYQGHFQRNLDAMLRTLIDEHPAGWSTICDKDFSMEPGFIEYPEDGGNPRPQCYCHGDRAERPALITWESAGHLNYTYIINDDATMEVWKNGYGGMRWVETVDLNEAGVRLR